MIFKQILLYLLIIVICILAVIFVPFIAIWAMNTLVPAAQIAYNFWTWLSVMILGVFFRGSIKLELN